MLLDMVRRGVRVPAVLPVLDAGVRGLISCAAPRTGSRRSGRRGDVFEHRPAAKRRHSSRRYLSGDFHQHATAQLMAGELFERHDPTSKSQDIPMVPTTISPMRAQLCFRLRPPDRHSRPAAPRGRIAYPCGRDRHPGRSQGLLLHQARPAIAAHRPAPVQVSCSRISRYHGCGFHRLYCRRSLRRSAQPAAVVFGKAGPPSPAAIR